VKLNGTARNTAWLPVELLSGKNNRLEFTLAKLPSRTWATQPADFPPSFDASGTIKQ
jgi:putative alpha-1,2-mannosidase